MIIHNSIGHMSTKRNFVNVGQALFAIEEHNGKTIVYDCGGESRLIVNAVLPYIMKNGSEIEILFISHYDNDHINGVQYLLRYCNVKHIVLPMVEEAYKFVPLINLPHNSFAYRFTMDARSAVRDEFAQWRELEHLEKSLPLVHYVEAAENSYGDALIFEPIPLDSLAGGFDIPANQAIRISSTDDWIYLPFNRKVMTQNEWEAFLEYLKLPLNTKCNDFIWQWKGHWIDEVLYDRLPWFPFERRHPLKDAWHEATGISFKEINDHSMTLYSGPAHTLDHYGCLFTGDYNAQKYMTELYHFYIKLWRNIELVQVPHHGSKSNFDEQLIISGATHVIPNKQVPSKRSDVNYEFVKMQIESKGERVVGAWEQPIK